MKCNVKKRIEDRDNAVFNEVQSYIKTIEDETDSAKFYELLRGRLNEIAREYNISTDSAFKIYFKYKRQEMFELMKDKERQETKDE